MKFKQNADCLLTIHAKIRERPESSYSLAPNNSIVFIYFNSFNEYLIWSYDFFRMPMKFTNCPAQVDLVQTFTNLF